MILDRIHGLLERGRGVDEGRRNFLVAGAAWGAAFSSVSRLGIPASRAHRPPQASSFAPDAFITIDPSGQVTLTLNYVEMGQGTYTAIPMLIAEELEVDVKRVRLQHAPPNAKLYGNPFLAGDQTTGGSTAIRASWEPMRTRGGDREDDAYAGGGGALAGGTCSLPRRKG